MADGPSGDDDSRREADSSVASVERSAPTDDGPPAADPSGPPEDEVPASGADRSFDFDRFGPADMERMTREEWEAAFDSDTWITGPELIERVERDLKARIGSRDVFAELSRLTDDRLLAYSDEGYAILYPDGSVEGDGSVLDDVTSSVVLCAMDEYDVPTPPEEWSLPSPEEVTGGVGELGNRMLQVVGGGLLVAGVVMLAGSALGAAGRAPILLVFMGVLFLIGGVFMFVIVANTRLSARFRVAEYRERLRSVGAGSNERPPFVPVEDEEVLGPANRRESEGTDDAS